MNAYRNLTLIALVVTAFAVLAPNARAQMPIQKIRVTISEPVEVPDLVLPIGTYVFEALEMGHVTRILSADENHIYATLSTIPDERREPMDNATVTFRETSKDDVERIDSWFFPGESIGNEFVYSKTPSDRISGSKIGAFTRETGRVTADSAEDVVAVPVYLAVHAERAVVTASVATGRFLGARFLVN